MKLMWTGSDTLFATRLVGGRKFPTKLSKYVYFLGCTIFAKIADLFVQEHYVDAENLIENLKPLKLKKPMKVLKDPPLDFSGLKRESHEGFNVLYYRGIGNNQKFFNWVYGYDIVLSAQRMLPYKINTYVNEVPNTSGINLIILTGGVDIKKIYAITDILIRPNRSDGGARMRLECEQIGIPYYWTKENPSASDLAIFIEEHYILYAFK